MAPPRAGGGFGGGFGPPRTPAAGAPPPPKGAEQQILEKGWAYAALNPGTIQADNGNGLTKGIIGLVNKGQHRKPEDWGCIACLGMGSRPRFWIILKQTRP